MRFQQERCSVTPEPVSSSCTEVLNLKWAFQQKKNPGPDFLFDIIFYTLGEKIEASNFLQILSIQNKQKNVKKKKKLMKVTFFQSTTKMTKMVSNLVPTNYNIKRIFLNYIYESKFSKALDFLPPSLSPSHLTDLFFGKRQKKSN